MHDDRRFLPKRFSLFKNSLVVAFKDNALDDTRAITKLQKYELSAGTRVIQPAFEGYFLANMVL
jgi:hypothetical protein